MNVIKCLVLIILAANTAIASETKTVRVLFIGNSYTFRNNLPDIVKKLAEAGNPGLKIECSRVVYGGRTTKHHWELRTQDILLLPELDKNKIMKICSELKEKSVTTKISRDADRYRASIRNHQIWMKSTGKKAPNWDYVVLQSYKDTDGGLNSSYAKYVRKFAPLIHKRRAKIILYNTAPKYQNADPLKSPPDPTKAIAETKAFAQLAKELNALLVPMPLAVVECQTARPDFALRYHKDNHLNQACAYLTACAFYAVMFDRSPEGLPVNSVTDPKIKDKKNPDKDPDGGPRKVFFPTDVRNFLQKIAWNAVQKAKAFEVK